jgi:hypothetical protein
MEIPAPVVIEEKGTLVWTNVYAVAAAIHRPVLDLALFLVQHGTPVQVYPAFLVFHKPLDLTQLVARFMETRVRCPACRQLTVTDQGTCPCGGAVPPFPEELQRHLLVVTDF